MRTLPEAIKTLSCTRNQKYEATPFFFAGRIEFCGATARILRTACPERNEPGSYACGVNLCDAAHYPPILQLEPSVGERSVQLKIEAKVHFLSALPNPADQQVHISVKEIDTRVQNCIIIITDTNGKVVNAQTLAKGQNSFVWYTQPSGSWYLFRSFTC